MTPPMTQGSLAALVALGAFHGLNPGMGWLFAVARGLQERSRALVLQSLPAIAAGHAASVGLVALGVIATGSVLTTRVAAVGGGALLVAFGLWRLLSKRHFRWVGMRLSLWQLACWSFLMSSVHGAGLMLLPVILGSSGAGSGPGGTGTHAMAVGAHSGTAAHTAGNVLSAGVFVTGVHTLAMFAVAGIVAVVVYEVVGLGVLRRAWFNVDRLWAVALIAAGAATVVVL
jgi:hypothetical protein